MIIEEPTDSLVSFVIHSECKCILTLLSLLVASLRVTPNSVESGTFEEGVNCTVAKDYGDARGYAMLDFTSDVIFDDVNLLFSVEDYTGSGSIYFSSQVHFYSVL